ncbi:NAD(P)H-dependent oxidoreductase [Bradyrhizobium sp. U87765 SZCCT0131]|uniref:FMN-dependent NADH-azoreductase n=1 Tax=unclassified Bradyrhizobium TaxID=2631580 RepID=UPI001BAAAB96|nr:MULTISPECIES: NAD(P)H-dependent oxidoreductase [unclassified Bradyrhizobium]MBR1218059.1 NAD(P)H-dependent oxidoreductase [Bradyrhizobium sp. U87765 SZCCT0131]MBR1260995.1 NAD(P)H-dependent oxidoreductase [Bradyrhizobium sp. U87765 SZCCT0134]MBR1303557.1 NAD(P)H-dependent oxidoreductase [Bradyrhizobium sp. U87765 SZCCT0110]MBR1319163.1 NAD(P)H-dependent oxidoreductase [Bradyrhizobium sp. U87765 SZCCT0109]MBR1347488.1 NAD(P)H-dependent oxidoreductase [Bradyrhizobium sp. U87765 SZCCT0048]
MKQILMIEVSPRGTDSASRAVANTLAARLAARYPSARLVRRDLAAEALPHLDGTTLRAITTRDPAETERLRVLARRSDELTDELLASDLLVIATPMWNFGIPSALKAWIDLVVRPGRTFQYADGSALGLAKDKNAILVLASGGVFTEGPWRPWDYVEPYLRRILGFIGITDVQTVRVEGTNIPSLAIGAVSRATEAVETLAL